MIIESSLKKPLSGLINPSYKIKLAMKKQPKQFSKVSLFIVAAICVAILGFIAFVIYNKKSEVKAQSQQQEVSHESERTIGHEASPDEGINAVTTSELAQVMPSDIVIGEASAPVTIVEYASLSCPHCAAFYREAFDRLKEEYIDSGKVKFVYRHFPLNHPALSAAMFVECNGNEKGRDQKEYYSLIKALFKAQDSWAFTPEFNDKLRTIAQLRGMNGDSFDFCIADEKLQKEILSKRIEAAKSLNIGSVPSFIINGEISEGYVDYISIQKIIEKKLSDVSR